MTNKTARKKTQKENRLLGAVNTNNTHNCDSLYMRIIASNVFIHTHINFYCCCHSFSDNTNLFMLTHRNSLHVLVKNTRIKRRTAVKSYAIHNMILNAPSLSLSRCTPHKAMAYEHGLWKGEQYLSHRWLHTHGNSIACASLIHHTVYNPAHTSLYIFILLSYRLFEYATFEDVCSSRM